MISTSLLGSGTLGSQAGSARLTKSPSPFLGLQLVFHMDDHSDHDEH